MKNSKKILIIATCISICILLLYIAQTYSRYISSAVGNAQISIAKWNIKVNDSTVKNNTDLSTVIEPIFPGSEHINPNIIAPTAEGYFDLNLDYVNADVSFDYEISVAPDPNSIVTDLIPTAFAIDDGTKTPIENASIISGTVLNSEEIRTKKIRVFVTWDDATGKMDNVKDTQATLDELKKATLNVNIKFIQKAI